VELGLGGASATADLNLVVGATTPRWQMQTSNHLTESRYERPSVATLDPSEGPRECGFWHTQTPLHASVQVSGAGMMEVEGLLLCWDISARPQNHPLGLASVGLADGPPIGQLPKAGASPIAQP